MINTCWRCMIDRPNIKWTECFPAEHTDLKIKTGGDEGVYAIAHEPMKRFNAKGKLALYPKCAYMFSAAKVCEASGHKGIGFIGNVDAFRGQHDWIKEAMADPKFGAGMEDGAGIECDKSTALHSAESQNQLLNNTLSIFRAFVSPLAYMGGHVSEHIRV